MLNEWESNGITGRGPKPGCAGNFKGLAVVMATGRCVWEDLTYRFDPAGNHAEVIAVNGMMLYWKDRVHHGVSLHAEEPGLWRSLRPYYQGEASHVLTHGQHRHEKPGLQECDVIWDIPSGKGGTSSLFATMIGLALGYTRIVLAGVPMDGNGHCYDAPTTTSRNFLGSHLEMEWRSAITNYFDGRVRSLSGRTRDWLGEPDADWLRGK